MSTHRTRPFWLALLAAALAACSVGRSTPQPAVLTRQPAPCGVPPGSPAIPDLTNPLTWSAQLLEYLDNGGLVTTLLDSLEGRPGLLEPGQRAAQLDLDHDGSEDLAIVLDSQNPAGGPPSGELLVFLCDQDHYRLLYITPPGETAGLPRIEFAGDLTGDLAPELLVSTESCGAHTCGRNLAVLSYNGRELVNILQDRSDDLPNPTLAVGPALPDGSRTISMTGTGISSAGAGPYRERTRTWTYDPASGLFTPAPDVLGDARFRIHVLHDADAAAETGDTQTALALYRRVIDDPSLDDWIYGETGQRTLAAFSMFRELWIALQQGDTGTARAVLDAMQASATNDSVDMLTLAETTFDAYQNGGLPSACSAAQAFAAAHMAGVLEPLNYGYANRAYSPPDLCLERP